jgi:hypothetical protein
VSPHGIFEGRRTHRYKSWPAHFEAAISGRKTFEVRADDRAERIETGDIVRLEEFNPIDNGDGPAGYTRRAALFLVGYVARGPALPPGVIGFELIPPELANRIGLAVLAVPSR